MAITVLAADDTDTTRTPIAVMPGRIDRGGRMSDGFCTGHANLPEFYGQMHSLPADMGAGCGDFEQATH